MTKVILGTEAKPFAARYPKVVTELTCRRPQSLARAVEVAVRKVDARCLKPVARPDAGMAFQSTTLLALLTFCYAGQVYSSATIAEHLKCDFNSRTVNGEGTPDAKVLARFRCENREPLGFCLKSALLYLAEEKIRQGFVTHVKEAHIAEEASRRIIMAMFTDSLEMEKAHRPDVPRELCFGVAGDRVRVH